MTSKIKVNNIEDTSGNAMVSKCGTTVTLGKTGDTIQLASGASQTGFGRTGTVDWDTTKKTASFTAVSGNGYFVDTSSSAITVTLPASPSAGDIVSISDYARNFETNNCTVGRNGSNIAGGAFDAILSINTQTVTFIYADSTNGSINTQQATNTIKGVNPYIVATGGTITTCGNFKIHTFTSPGTFTVSCGGLPSGANTVDYLVVGGGGSGGRDNGGGAGAGGVRFSCGTFTLPSPAPASPRGCVSSLPISEQAYPITVGAGGTGSTPSPGFGAKGSDSIFSTITSAGGGGGGTDGASLPASIGNGGSGGGAGQNNSGPGTTAGTGNTPPVSPAQGSDGGTAPGPSLSGGAGGGGFIGSGVPSPTGDANGGAGGAGGGFPTAFGANGVLCGSFRYYGGGGGGGTGQPSSGSGGSAGLGGGTAGGPNGNDSSNATANTGGASGGGGQGGCTGNGGSGIVVIRYQFQSS